MATRSRRHSKVVHFAPTPHQTQSAEHHDDDLDDDDLDDLDDLDRPLRSSDIHAQPYRRYSIGPRTPVSPPFLHAPPPTPQRRKQSQSSGMGDRGYRHDEYGYEYEEADGVPGTPRVFPDAYTDVDVDADRGFQETIPPSPSPSPSPSSPCSWKTYLAICFFVVIGMVKLGAEMDDPAEGASSSASASSGLGLVGWVVLLVLLVLLGLFIHGVGMLIVEVAAEGDLVDGEVYEDEDEDEDEDGDGYRYGDRDDGFVRRSVGGRSGW